MSILKIEAFSGLSGDMFLGALADLTGAYDELIQLPQKLNLKKVKVIISNVEKAGIACKHIKIVDRNTYEKKHTHHHSHSHTTDKSTHHHEHTHKHVHHAHTHGHEPHRHLKDIFQIIDNGDISKNSKRIAKGIFQLLGEAESKVHGVDIHTIHFHEVGAIDSILDIVGSAFLLDKLRIEKVYCTPVCTGRGFVMADHGRMPVPAPATKELLLGIPTYEGKASGEMTTPTGAAILKYLNPDFNIPVLVENQIGHGPGEKDFEHPNVLRLSFCESAGSDKDEIMMVETNIDDMPSELLGQDFQEKLFSAGAIDFYYTQIIMKKGRPGVLLSVFTSIERLKEVSDFLLENTSTIGVRTYSVSRIILKRRIEKINTSLGEVQVKIMELPSGGYRRSLEYESVRKLAEKLQIPLKRVYATLDSEIQLSNDI